MNKTYRKEFQYRGQAINYWNKMTQHFADFSSRWMFHDYHNGVWVIEYTYE